MSLAQSATSVCKPGFSLVLGQEVRTKLALAKAELVVKYWDTQTLDPFKCLIRVWQPPMIPC